jgi:acyl-CoA synthetase (NDP forming)
VSGPSRPALNLKSLFGPEAIAVIGASPDPGRHNGRPIANLLRTGFADSIHPVNPRYDQVGELRCHASVLDVEEPIDLAYVMVRADLVEQAVEDCCNAGVTSIVVCTSGFAEESIDGRLRQDRLRERAWRSGSRIIGPNCIGVVGVPERAVSCTTLNITSTLTPGAATIVSQSGGMAANLFNIAQGEGVGIRGVLSLGNEADVDLADVVEQLAFDPLTEVVLLYVEQLRDVTRFRHAVRTARSNGKHVLALKGGRTNAGTRSTQSHTGAMSGSFAVFRDVMTAAGVQVVESITDLVDGARLLQELPALKGKRLLVVSPSGGECGYVSDLAEAAGLAMPDLSPELRAELAAVMRFGTPGNPLDLTGQVIGDESLLHAVFGAIEKYREYDAVLVALPTWGEFDSARLMPPILEAAARSRTPVVLSAWQARHLTEFRDELLRNAPVVHFDSADRAVRALSTLALSQETGPAEPAEPLPAPPGIDVPAECFEHEAAAKAFLSLHGLPVSEERLVPDLAAAAELSAALAWPVVVKGVAPGVGHKSELGLVAVGVQDAASLADVCRRMEESARTHGIELTGFLVARQYTGLELILGSLNDPELGQVMIIGAGGVLAEILDDKVFLACPTSRADARAAVAGLKVGRLLQGHRGVSYDLDSLLDLVVRFSELVPQLRGIDQVDLNPVVVAEGRGGSVIVDALVVPVHAP